MRILIVNAYHYLRGGDCTYTFQLADLLRKHGHDVMFFAMKHPDNIPCEQDKYFVEYIDFNEANKHKNLKNIYQVSKRAIYSRHARNQIGRLLDDVKPDIAHLQNIQRHITPSILYEFKNRHIPVVWTLHDYQFLCPNSHFLSNGVICEACKGKRFYQCILKRCQKNSLSASVMAAAETTIHELMGVAKKVNQFIVPSKFMLQKFIEHGWDKEHISYLPPFLPITQSMSELNQPDNGSVIYIGRLEDYKGIRTLVRSIELVREIPFRIIGDGTARSSSEQLATDLGLTNITFTGFLRGDALRRELEGSSFVVVPSECYENAPFVVLEAMAAGKPVIASRLGGIPELVQDGFTGLLFEPGDYRELAEKIRILYSDTTLRDKLRNSARDICRVKFDEERHYTGLLKIYHEYCW